MRALPTPSMDDRPRFHMNMPVSELIERDTRAIEASVVSSAPLVAKTKDGVTHETRPNPMGLGGSSHPTLNLEIRVRRSAHGGPKAATHRTRARGENADQPQRPLPNPH